MGGVAGGPVGGVVGTAVGDVAGVPMGAVVDVPCCDGEALLAWLGPHPTRRNTTAMPTSTKHRWEICILTDLLSVLFRDRFYHKRTHFHELTPINKTFLYLQKFPMFCSMYRFEEAVGKKTSF